MRPPYVMLEIEIADPLAPITLPPGSGGAHVLLRYRDRPVGRIWLSRAEHGDRITPTKLKPLIASASQHLARSLAVLDALKRRHGADMPAPTPSLTIAVCTRNRAHLLQRCLTALVGLREARTGSEPKVEILVVDNAPPNSKTRDLVANFPDARYEMEPVPGLNMGRNRVLANARTDFIGFVDDDAVVDRGWLDTLSEAIKASPRAAAFTGPVLPLVLETEAQIRFERSGGFGEGMILEYYDVRRWGDRIYPASAGRLGTGANMVFSVRVLRELGGFDEALDTGPPLPGGGDLDMFYRLVRAGHRLVYSPGQLVHHEHRRDITGLRKQYHSWGLSVMTLLQKSRKVDPAMRREHLELMLWWLTRRVRRLAWSMAGRGPLPPELVLAEILGGVQGCCGEYRRSQRRMAARKREFAR